MRQLLFWVFLVSANVVFGQFTHQDSIRGSITPERSWWDLTSYILSVKVDIQKKYLSGNNVISFTALQPGQVLQVDLQEPLKITRATYQGLELKIAKDGYSYLISLPKPISAGTKASVQIYYEGNPLTAKNAPWDGGISWSTDSDGQPFVASSCQGIGASIWWPNKDHMYDEVESMTINVTVPKGLMDVSNGQLVSTVDLGDWTLYSWQVKNPINNYGVNMNIGNYAHWTESYAGINGPLKVDYFPLKENLNKAKEQWKQVAKMLTAFEYWFGPYPFYEDGFKLVEVPYLGMEHQSSITYGNGYSNGYRGRDLSDTGWGLDFDFIIIHESGHEWFANNITYKDIADMWIHESFTAYSECLYVEYYNGKKAGAEYVLGTRLNIQNDKPIIGPYNVNQEGSGDMYYKGSNMLHTLRQVANNDSLWRSILVGLNKDFYHQTVTTEQIEKYISAKMGIDLDGFFDQYLRSTMIPIFSYGFKGKSMIYKWDNAVGNFAMPVDVWINGKKTRLVPTTDWNFIPLPDPASRDIKVDINYYVGQLCLTEK